MKERVLVFSDAVIAIILTIIVLELPITYATGGVDLRQLFGAVGIYFISFCFVGNLWFQTAYAFNRIENVRSRELVYYMLLLFFLSLVPSATRLLIEDTTRQTVLIYGVLTLIVTVLMRRLLVALVPRQTGLDEEAIKRREDELNRQDFASFGFRILLLIFGYFFIKAALVVYLILPIMAFMQNMVDREENEFVATLDEEEQQDYYHDRNQLWGNSMKRYSNLLRESFKDESNKDPEQWKHIMDNWQQQVDLEIKRRTELLDASKNDRERQHIQQEIRQLSKQKDRLEQRETQMKRREGKRRRKIN